MTLTNPTYITIESATPESPQAESPQSQIPQGGTLSEVTALANEIHARILPDISALASHHDTPDHVAGSLAAIREALLNLLEPYASEIGNTPADDTDNSDIFRANRLLHSLNPDKEVPGLTLLDARFIIKCANVIEQNIGEPALDLSFLQTSLNMSHSTLYRRLKQLTGFSANELIRAMRIRHSRLKLIEGYTVAEAAYNSGFNDLGYFRNCFKERYGQSPSTYAKLHNGV